MKITHLSPTLRNLAQLEQEKRLNSRTIRERRIEYFREKVRITCNACKKRSSLREWEFIHLFRRAWHTRVGLGDLKGMATFEPRATQFCLVQCPACRARQEVGLSLESAYIVTAIEDYKIHPDLLFVYVVWQQG